MDLNQLRKFILLTKPLYFGWLLAFPYYGPVFNAAAPAPVIEGYSLFLVFAVAHALTYLSGGFFIKNHQLCLKMMIVSLVVTLFTNASLFLPFDILWLPAMAVLGIASAIYILGWCCFYSLFIPNVGRLKLMAAVIIWGNVILIIFNLLADLLPGQVLLALVLLPLAAAGLVLFRYDFSYLQLPKKIKEAFLIPRSLLIIICLFVLAVYLNGGLMFNIILPSLDVGVPFSLYYRFVPYIIFLLFMYLYGERLQKYFPIYVAVSLLGLAFISFALFSEVTAGFFLTTGLLEAAFAMIDLFVWVILGSLAFIYKAPFKFFGLALAANLGGIILGDLLGEYLLQTEGSVRLMTAIIASMSIFVVILIIPWLNQQTEKNLPQVVKDDTLNYSLPESVNHKMLEAYLLPGEKLTPREIEVTMLILKGYTNDDMAKKLFVTSETMKTHLKNIYDKFGVKKKNELILLLPRQYRDI